MWYPDHQITYARETEADEADEQDLSPWMRVEAHQLGRVRLAEGVDLLLLADLSIQVLDRCLIAVRHLLGIVRHAAGSC